MTRFANPPLRTLQWVTVDVAAVRLKIDRDAILAAISARGINSKWMLAGRIDELSVLCVDLNETRDYFTNPIAA